MSVSVSECVCVSVCVCVCVHEVSYTILQYNTLLDIISTDRPSLVVSSVYDTIHSFLNQQKLYTGSEIQTTVIV